MLVMDLFLDKVCSLRPLPANPRVDIDQTFCTSMLQAGDPELINDDLIAKGGT